jgi:phosphatidylinositol alpha 1,6-mannosyltransferase
LKIFYLAHMALRVAIVTESFLPQINGVTNSVIRVLETLKQREHEAIVIAPTSPSPKFLGFDVVQVPNLPLLQFAVGVPAPAVSRALEAFRPDVIHVAAPFLLGAQAIGWGQRNNVPTVAIYQTDVAGYLERYNLAFAKGVMERLVVAIHQNASLNLAPTSQSAQYLRGIGVPRVETWGRGVDLDLFSPRNKASEESLRLRREVSPTDRPIIGFVGRLANEKQVERMVELFGLDADFLVVGDGPERARLEALFGQRARFTGSLSGLELANAYAAMDLFVHYGEEETFGQTIQEAKATGLCVIAPAVGGPINLIEHGVSGYLVPKGQSFVPQVQTLLSNPQLRSAISTQAQLSVQGKSWETNNAKLLGYYAQATKSIKPEGLESIELA